MRQRQLKVGDENKDGNVCVNIYLWTVGDEGLQWLGGSEGGQICSVFDQRLCVIALSQKRSQCLQHRVRSSAHVEKTKEKKIPSPKIIKVSERRFLAVKRQELTIPIAYFLSEICNIFSRYHTRGKSDILSSVETRTVYKNGVERTRGGKGIRCNFLVSLES